MNACDVRRVEARFALEGRESNLQIVRNECGGFELFGSYAYLETDSFPSRRTAASTGRLFDSDLQDLLDRLFAAIDLGWYHHYDSRKIPYTTFRGWFDGGSIQWCIRIDRRDGSVLRWEGTEGGPDNLSTAYNLMVDYGMPSLEARFGERIRLLLRYPAKDYEAFCLACYGPLFDRCLKEGQEGDESAELSTLTDEFMEDVARFLEEYGGVSGLADGLTPEGLTSIKDLCERDVSSASRNQIFECLRRLVHVEDRRRLGPELFGGGVWGRWFDRLREIPREEQEARQREREARRYKEQLEREKLNEEVRAAIARRVATGEVFTSYDVAKDMGVTAQRASVCIRSFVRSGELKTVGDDYPRRYKAA